MARPKLKIDESLVEKLAAIQCTPREIGAIVGCSEDTILGRFSALVSKGKEHGRMSLRRAMFKRAISGNATMMIWLSKQYLGMTDKVESKEDKTIELTYRKVEEIKTMSREELQEYSEKLLNSV